MSTRVISWALAGVALIFVIYFPFTLGRMSPRVMFFWVMTLVMVLFALWKGRWEEQTFALTAVVGLFVSRMIVQTGPGAYEAVQYPMLALDFSILAVFIFVTLKSDRFWPMWASGFMLLGASSHLFKMLDPDMAPRLYAAAERAPSYLVTLAILIGTWRTWKMRKADAASEPTAV